MENDGSSYLNGDPKPSKEDVEKALGRHGLAWWVELIEGFSIDVARNWENEKIGLLFIDGNHRTAKRDYDAWKPYFARDAIVAFHDSNNDLSGKFTVHQDIISITKTRELTKIKTVDSLAVFRYNGPI